MNRAQWLREVRRGRFLPGERVLRGTLLLLPDVMAADGSISVPKDKLLTATGLPGRTLERHLSRAVAAGWLTHGQRGGNGRLSVYRACTPDELSATTGGSCPPQVACSDGKLSATSGEPSAGVVRHPLVDHSTEVVRHLVADSNKESASVSEHGALDQGRDRRPDHDGSRVPPDQQHQQHQEQRTDEAAPDTTTTVADSPNTSSTEPNCSECRRRTAMGDNSGCHRLTAGQYCPFPQLDVKAS